MKELKRKSWVFKIAYGVYRNIPTRVGRCALFWRFVFMLLIGLPITLVVFTILISVFSVVGFFYGYRPSLLKSDGKKSDPLVPIRHWPTVGGHRVWPICIVLIGVILFFIPQLTKWAFLIFQWTFQYIGLLGMFMGGVSILVLIYYFLCRFKTTDMWMLFQDYLSDRKKKLCPMIPIEPAPAEKEDQV